MMQSEKYVYSFFWFWAFSFCIHSHAQNGIIALTRNNSPAVYSASGRLFNSPWTGGMNFTQAGNPDLNMDGKADLVMFDRSGNRIITFLYNESGGNENYLHDFRYESKFPNDIQEFMLMHDFDCDGKSDIFTYENGGIKVYRNTSTPGAGLSFKLYVSQIQSDFRPSKIPIFTLPIDVPAIQDLDEDGDSDILVFGFGGRCIEYHRNKAREYLNRCDTIIFELETDNWGVFTEDFSSNSITLNDSCDNPGGRFEIRHAGSSVLPIDLDGDSDKDLIMGDVSYPGMIKLLNGGTKEKALITSQDNNFPGETKPVNLSVFPAAYPVDINHDGKRDLIICPNSESNSENYRCIWYYKNTGTKEKPVFLFVSDTFLIDQTLDFGQGSIPVFFDHNGDGKMDLIVGNDGYYSQNGVRSRLALLENQGDEFQPIFKLIDRDYAGLAKLPANIRSFHPAFCDVDGDGDSDMLCGGSDGQLIYMENIAPQGEIARFTFNTSFFENIDVGTYAAPFPFDVDGDNNTDLIIGNGEGKIWYYHNKGEGFRMSLSLVSDHWGSVDLSNEDYPQGFSRPVLFKKDGKNYLISGSAAGKYFLYDGLESSLFNSSDSLKMDFSKGKKTAIAIYDLNNDGYPDAITGNESGGLIFFSGYNPVFSGFSIPDDNPRFYLSPNPGWEHLNFCYPGKNIKEISVTDLKGVGFYYNAKCNQADMIQIPAESWPAGIYLVRFLSGERYVNLKWVHIP